MSHQAYSSAYSSNALLTDVEHYDADLNITVSPPTIGGSVVMHFKSLAEGLSEFLFRLHSSYVISKVELNGSPVSFERLSNPEVRAFWPGSLNIGDSATLSVFYQGSIPASDPTWFGGVNVVNGMVYSYAQPWNTHHWLAVKEPPGVYEDKSTADLRYTVPSTLKVASNGSLISETTNAGGTKAFHWKTSYPTAPYLLAFSAAAYSKVTRTFTYENTTMPVEFYLLPGMSSALPETLQVNSMLTTLSSLLGPYPFLLEKYGIAAWDTSVGGMEHQTISGQRRRNSGGPDDLGGEKLTVHELAHQWFGNSVTCQSLNHIWLNESFATYMEAIWEEFKPGSSGRGAYLSAMVSKHPGSASSGVVYVANPTSTANTFSSAQYKKGAWILHMLRQMLGDETFFQGLRTYLERHAYQSAITEDFQAVFEEVSGRDLGYFFDQWVYSYGAPKIEYGLFQTTVNGNKYINVMIKQSQTTRLFDLEIPVRINTTAGTFTYLVHSTAARQNFLIPIQGSYQSIQVDPENHVLKNPMFPQSASFVWGSPKIIAVSEQPHLVSETAPQSITFDFSAAVTIPADAVRLVGDIVGEKQVSTVYNASTFRLTVNLPSDLEPDSYQLIVLDSISEATGLKLDGEMPGGIVGMAIPSGDGIEGGSFNFPFVIEGDDPCLGSDLSGNGVIEFDDLTQVLALWGQAVSLDPTGDGTINFDDLTRVLACWGSDI